MFPLPIGEGQTHLSAIYGGRYGRMRSFWKGKSGSPEIGAGSGYQAAVLSRLAREVIAVEVQLLCRFFSGNARTSVPPRLFECAY